MTIMPTAKIATADAEFAPGDKSRKVGRANRALSAESGYAATAKDMNWLKGNIPCQAACPAGTDIPGYLEAIYKGDFEDAYQTQRVLEAAMRSARERRAVKMSEVK